MFEPLVVDRDASRMHFVAETDVAEPDVAATDSASPVAASQSALELRGKGQSELVGPLPRGYSVVVPVYRGRETLPLLVERVERVLSGLGSPYEILLVNDGSPDDSWSVISQLAPHHRASRR